MSTNKAPSKKGSRPGRKPLTTEPKNKRTAQNRAAQRAFRERKERKMRELQDKVKKLEDEKLQITNEKELLRSQVQTLLQELSRFRNEQLTDLPQQQSPYSAVDPSDSSISSGTTPEFSNSMHTPQSSATSTTAMSISGGGKKPITFSNDTYKFPSGWSFSGSNNKEIRSELDQSNFKGDFDEGVSHFCSELNEACGTKSCPFPKSKRQELEAKYADSEILNHNRTPTLKSNDTSGKVSEIGVQKGFSKATSVGAPFFNLIKSQAPAAAKPSDEMNFLLDSMGVDPSVSTSSFTTPNPTAFNEEEFLADNFSSAIKRNTDNLEDDTLGGLVTESSKYDPLDEIFGSSAAVVADGIDGSLGVSADTGDLINSYISPTTLPAFSTDADGNAVVKDETDKIPKADSKVTTQSNSDVVPDSNKSLMKCSQIWERITSHPRFSEIDIDGLCKELKEKAKCSEHGVVVDGKDVGKLINDAVDNNNHESKVKENHFLKGVTC
ncbi:hypothetical protein HII13_000802 [Brettanomyces bruxellensis]|uniref:Uncharacterized protein n=1 Tax=Dekkera bruxellensis TaxID=5007 RepID=A0A8H6BN10_DEKBR|nr:uncharacterized protein BRETT_001574 [Brettanomyces bruxellensis]KAF6014457.1 hypothetical protein HII13_000802 [Brettanomyces bruxellensis]QOU18511.1 hypothetical protein BRETT_001574 [Brettanomyces bruxellensis]